MQLQSIHINLTKIVIGIPLFIIALGILNCRRQTPAEMQIQTPYSSLAEQRTILADKEWVMPTRILDSIQIIEDLRYLSVDSCEGRLPGTMGHSRAMARIINRMRSAGIDSFDNSLTQLFSGADGVPGKNIIGWIKGTASPEKYIVISAHYDHLGKSKSGLVYHGADDNASGVSCLLALAAYFKAKPHPYSLIFAAFDKEESRLEGAHFFCQQWKNQGKFSSIKFNLNMDMIARSDSNEIFACGIYYYPAFMSAINEVQIKTNVKLLMGHDGAQTGSDWSGQSDHYAFFGRYIPFIYFGVENHSDYHEPTDKFEKIDNSRYLENCNMIALLIQTLRP